MIKNKENYNEYLAAYMKRRYHERRREAISILGGKCIKCGTDKNLELDHRDWNKKVFDGTRMTSVSYEKFITEVNKCQLLCKKHHTIKTVVIDWGRKMAKGNHGVLSSYRYCKCVLCRKAKSDWTKKYRLTHKRKEV